MSSKTAVVSCQKMAGNKNCNNNHNTPEARPLPGNLAPNEGSAVASRNEVLEETREVVQRFLERSLSQNAKSSMTFLKPEGYHRLKRDGKLQFYQRQQSKPEQGSLTRKKSILEESQPHVSQKATHDRLSYTKLPSRPSLNELTSASKTTAFPGLSEQDQTLNKSENDVRTLQKLSESKTPEKTSDKPNFQPMGAEAKVGNGSLHSTDSLASASEDGVIHHLRTKSFSKAMSRKSVISFIESKKKDIEATSEDATRRTNQEKSSRSEERDMSAKTTSLHRRDPSSMGGASHHPHQTSDHKDEELGRHGRGVEKKTSFSNRLKKMMVGTSNKRKIKYKKSFEQPKPDEPSGSSESWKSDERRSTSAGVARSTSSSETALHRQPSSLKHPTSAPNERGLSPVKSKPQHAPMGILRSLSQKTKGSPKPKRRPLHQSGSSSSLSQYTVSAPVGGELERNKSGSLPISMRYGVGQSAYSSNEERRHSEGFHPPQPTNRHDKHTRGSSKRSSSPSQAVERPQHLDLNNKKTKGPSKLKRFFLRFRKRTTSESSTGSSRSQSLPSIPAALESDTEFQAKDVDTEESSEANLVDSVSDDNKLTASCEDLKPYHHRGSLSFSSGDLDGMSLPDKQKIYNDIAETLRRLSSQYNQRIQSRSSTPGSRLTTPESSFSAEEYRQYAKNSHPGPPSRQRSGPPAKTPIHGEERSYRKHKDEGQRALNAYHNLREQGRSGDPHRDNTPRSLLIRRHTHHAQTGSLDSPYSDERHSQARSSGLPKPNKPPATSASDAPVDVTDGPPASALAKPASSSSWESRSECTETDCAVRSFHPRTSVTTSPEAQRSIASTRLGSDVDVPSRDQSSMTPEGNRLQASRPSTSRTNSESEPNGSPNTEPIDEDKLVDLLVDALCKKGDEYTRSIDSPNGLPLEPVLRSSMIRYMSRVTYHHFEHFAKRFCQNFQQLVETSPTRHPDIFPVVMVFNMTQLIVNLASSEVTQNVVSHAQTTVNHVLTLSTQLVTNIVQTQGNGWGTVLEQLQDTEDELKASETPDDLLRRHANTDDELD